jgi:hypothetical protein
MHQLPPETSIEEIPDELTAEESSRMAVTAVVTDLEHWARTSSNNGHVGVNDLIRVLDMLREASLPAA